MSKRNTYKYELTKGNKVVYIGITNNPERREAEHRQNKNFDKMKIVGNVSTLDGASQWETNRIQTYMNTTRDKHHFTTKTNMVSSNVMLFTQIV